MEGDTSTLGTRILSETQSEASELPAVHELTLEPETNGLNGSVTTEAASSPTPPLITDERLNLLWPQPKHVQQLSGDICWFPRHIILSVAPSTESVHK